MMLIFRQFSRERRYTGKSMKTFHFEPPSRQVRQEPLYILAWRPLRLGGSSFFESLSWIYSAQIRCLTMLSITLLAAGAAVLPAFGQEAIADDLPTQGQLYVPMTFPVSIDPSTYDNPFDVNDIELLGVFQSPSDRELVISGFWMQPQIDQCQIPCEVENLQPSGDPIWQVRFTPQEVGEWSYSLQVRDNGSLISSQEGRFEVRPSDRRGFIRVGANQRHFQYQNGQPYFPIGHNLKWSWDGGGGLRAYQRWLRELSAAGGNFARLFIDVPWFIHLEWEGTAGDYRNAQAAAARLDAILATAAEQGIALQLVLLWHQTLSAYTTPPVVVPDTFPRPDVGADWDNHPYNILNGGPLSGPGIFFFDEEARELFQRRLRYIVARWGYSPQIFAWEIIDEIDRTVNYDPAVADAWLQDMASFLKQIDQHGHLITAGSRDFNPTLLANPLLDFTTGRFYQRRPIETVSDQVGGVLDVIRRNLDTNPVPTQLTAFSLNPWFEPTAEDPEGIHVQTTLWAAALSGAGGGAASDWWDTYIMPQNLQRYYAPLAAFATGVDWPNLDLQPAQAGALSADGGYSPVRISEFDRRLGNPISEVVTHTVTADGVIPPISDVPAYLYGQVYSSQLSQAQLYRIAAPVDTYLEIRVRRVSSQAGARLVVTVDDQTVTELELAPDSRDVAVRVPLTAGEHSVVLDNFGDDWLELEYLEVGHLLAPARVLTLRDSTNGVALAWVQHRDYTWENVAAGVERALIALQYRLDQMPAGLYHVEIWDPLSGAVLGDELVRVGEDGALLVDLLPMDSQLALRAFRQPDAPLPTATLIETLPMTNTPASTITAFPTSSPSLEPTSNSAETPTRSATRTLIPTLAADEPTPLAVQTNTPRPSGGGTPEI